VAGIGWTYMIFIRKLFLFLFEFTWEGFAPFPIELCDSLAREIRNPANLIFPFGREKFRIYFCVWRKSNKRKKELK
jgi:hypothetical protein